MEIEADIRDEHPICSNCEDDWGSLDGADSAIIERTPPATALPGLRLMDRSAGGDKCPLKARTQKSASRSSPTCSAAPAVPAPERGAPSPASASR
jgi:hypothetical protein